VNKMNSQKPIKLRVAEALQDDAYRGIARIDFEVMKELGIRRGDVILIKGGRETVAIADKAYPADVGEGIIRIDGIIRKNARTGVSENVAIAKANFKEAKKVTIAPAQKGIHVQGDLKPGLLGRVAVKGDVIVLGGVQRRKDVMSDDFGDMINWIKFTVSRNMHIHIVFDYSYFRIFGNSFDFFVGHVVCLGQIFVSCIKST